MGFKWITTVCYIQCLILTVTVALPSITINDSSSSKQTYELNDTVKITCTISSNYSSISSYYIQRSGRNFEDIGNSYSGSTTKTITCDDNTYYRCYGRFNGTGMYSPVIYVTVDCPPTWAESVKSPVSYYSAQASNKYFDLLIIGQPKPTYSVQKYEPSGLQDLPIDVDVLSYSNKVRLYFRTYSEDSHGIYHIEANNSIGMLITNLTLRGLILPSKYVRAWSTTPNSIHIEWTAGELFETAPLYKLYYKSQYGQWGSNVNVKNVGSTVTYIFNNFKPNTTYYFLLTAYDIRYGTSVYSNLAQGTTLTNPSDPPQTKPPIDQTVFPDFTTISQSTPKTEVATDDKIVHVYEQEDLTFGAGIGVGIGIGLLLAIIAIMGTVIYFKRSPSTQEVIPPSIRSAETEGGRMNMNVTDGLYEQLSRPHTGVSYDNKACQSRP
ncbi:hypothetical protein LOTGIDRAFT_228572 [Lottia gigantea]|uniref:Fibronectin type-III domain-containing protein n=1 Tax=Lottia gigantea TaxID=225164 RepID=V4AJQ4_LOTGI|nr:hypothetical protein LOTGIDRAFT_228572 [Lottia gigantea]ESO93806.1 hypothetical protein LOTGIDRAFT_228572 [Lottia gigantea]